MAEQTLRPYNPTWRDKLGSYLYDMTSGSPEARNFVGGLVGSRGLGSTGMGVVDATPIGMGLQFQESAQNGDAKGMALAAIPMPMKAGAGMVKRAVEEVAPAVERGIIAYHGSPHSFDSFDLSKIGTGEGAQAYGHGLYFAEHEPVAQEYKIALSGLQNRSGEVIKPDWSDPAFLGVQELRKANFDPVKAREAVVAKSDNWPEQVAAFDKMVSEGAAPTAGSMYQVRINADPEHFLDYEKPLSAQSPVVQDLVAKIPAAPDRASWPHITGNDLHEQLRVDAMGDDAFMGSSGYRMQRRNEAAVDVAKALREAGIPGIKYLDQGSRSAGEGSRNYVVFDDKLVEILKKYGLAGLLAGGAGMGMMQPEDAQAQTR